jgi:hypothetical protein
MSRQSDSNGIGTKPFPKLESDKELKVNVGFLDERKRCDCAAP